MTGGRGGAGSIRRKSFEERLGQPVIVVHIGLKKSGSASIQSFLSANEDSLRGLGVDYPRLGRSKRKAHHQFANEIQGRRKFDAGAGTLSQLGDYWRGTSGRVMILSSEMFEECETAEAARLRDILGRGQDAFRIVLVLRDLVELMPSSYAQKVKYGLKTYNFDSFFNERIGHRRVNYFETASRWAEAFGWESMQIRLLDPRYLLNGDLIDDFMNLIGLEPSSAITGRLERVGVWRNRDSRIAGVLIQP